MSVLVLNTEPAGATVFLDGQMKGVTPLTLDWVQPGDHTVVFQLKGYQNRTIDVRMDYSVKTIDIVLQPNEKPTTTATTAATTSETTAATTSPTATATTAQPVTIAQISPTYIHITPGSASAQTISITGTGLTTPTGMKLTGLSTIAATTYTAASDSSATGEFSIPSGTTGSYSVVLVDSAGTTLATSTTTVAIASYS